VPEEDAELPASDVFAIGTGEDEGFVFAPDRSGWAVFKSPVYRDRMLVFLRFARRADPGARIVVCEARFEAWLGNSLTTRMLGSLPLSRFEARVNQPGFYERVANQIDPDHWGKGHVPFPEVPYVIVGEPPNAMPEPWWALAPGKPTRRPRLRLKIPTGRVKPDKFYVDVAEAFAYLVVTSSRPATDLAEANDVPVTTVHRWVREARRRGVLPPASRPKRHARDRPASA
jgi:hypothetical protein